MYHGGCSRQIYVGTYKEIKTIPPVLVGNAVCEDDKSHKRAHFQLQLAVHNNSAGFAQNSSGVVSPL